LPEIAFASNIPEISRGGAIYVLDGAYWRGFIAEERLEIVYRGVYSPVVVAVNPNAVESPLRIAP
jgi:hypothetical protein